jgi:ribosomal-protein-alanine N-acetyltransferase
MINRHSSMNISIRKAAYTDIDKINEIESAGTALWNREQFTAELRLDFSNLMVLESDGNINGYCVFWNVAEELQLNNFGIRPGYRRRGLGTLMLNHIMALHDAKKPRPRKIILEVSSENHPAIGFYKKNGFIETGRRNKYYKQGDAILMEKEIPS